MELQCCNWNLKYSMAKDGASLHTMMKGAGSHAKTLLIIVDEHGVLFGAVTNNAWNQSGDQYYGNDTLVFSFHVHSGVDMFKVCFLCYQYMNDDVRCTEAH